MVPCKVHILLTEDPLSVADITRLVQDGDCGAQLVFLGCTRRSTGEKTTVCLQYEAYREMAENELRKLAVEASERWPIRHLVIHHRLGRVEVGLPSVVVAASSPHRDAVMESIPWIMHRLKQEVPIWKRETWDDGTTEWVHPIDSIS